MLDKILQAKEQEIKLLKETLDTNNIMPKPKNSADKFLVKESRVKIIAEIKRASPVKGSLNLSLDPVATAKTYAENGAAAISVITEKSYFKGNNAFLTAVKDEVNLPILRKDFIIDEIQLYETLNMGADMVLLIAGILSYSRLLKLIETCSRLSIEPLVEVHSELEAKMLADLPIRIAGINNRNLNDFTVDINHSLRLAEFIPDNIFKVSESGISKPADLLCLEKHGFNAALIGEALVTSSSPAQKLKELANYQVKLYD